MNRAKWNLKKRAALFLTVLLVDGMLLGAAGGVAERLWGCSRISRIVEPQACITSAETKQIALTFDDGPHAVCTKQLLDGLKERKVPVTFFLMGENIGGNEELVKRMQQEGHLIGNHSYRHIQSTKVKVSEVCQFVERTEEMIEQITGIRPQYLRPPYGDWNEELECRMDQTTVFWTIDSLDWKLQNKDKIVKRVLKKAEDGGIILMHDIFPESVEAALEIIDRLSSEGYQFVTVDALMID